MEIRLNPITENNFVDAFHLRLAQGQEAFVSHPIRSLAQAYVYRNQYQPFGIYSGALRFLLHRKMEEMKMELSIEAIKENMIRWAMEHLDRPEYIGWCLSFVEDAIEESNSIEIFGGDSAKESYLLYRDALHTGTPERGSVVFYDCLCHTSEGVMDWGHCGIALEDGNVIHAWNRVRIDGYLAIEELSAAGEHPRYLGWVPLQRVLQQKPL